MAAKLLSLASFAGMRSQVSLCDSANIARQWKHWPITRTRIRTPLRRDQPGAVGCDATARAIASAPVRVIRGG